MIKVQRADTRVRIVETALRLLRRHGVDKLTVVDIAKALGMSHANVYRFFRNKTDILDAVVDVWVRNVERFLREVVGRPGSAGSRIEAVVITLYQARVDKFREEPELYHAFQQVFELRPEAAEQHRQTILGVLRELIVEGIEAGEFARVDVAEAAAVLNDAVTAFLHPLLVPLLRNPTTAERARRLVAYQLAAFRTPPPPAPVVERLGTLDARSGTAVAAVPRRRPRGRAR